MDEIKPEHLHLLIGEDLYLAKNPDGNTAQKDQSEKQPEISEVKEQPVETVEKDQLNEAVQEYKVLDKRLLVVTEPLTDASKETLSKIVSALKIDLNNTMIIESWPDSFDHEKAIIFGYSDKHSHLLNTPITVEKSELLAAHTITHLDSNREEKLALWNALKSWYGI